MAKTCALACALSISSCSLLLDWNGYTGNALTSDDAGGLSDGPRPADALDETRDVTVGSYDAQGAHDSGDPADTQEAEPGDTQEAEPGDTGGPETGKAAPSCSLSNGCLGCCNSSGQCAGGYSAQTCGVNGEACQNCSDTGLVCVSETCSTPSEDAGPPPACVIAACDALHRCIPVWQSACCRDDQTCGCQIMIPSSAPCL